MAVSKRLVNSILQVGFCVAVSMAMIGCSRVEEKAMADQNPMDRIVPHSVTISVADVEASAQWYREKLGLEEVQRKTYPEFNTSLVFLEHNGYRVELIQDGNATTGDPRPDPPGHTASYGISQFAFRTEDLESIKIELENRQVPIVWEFENEALGAKFLFIRDLDENLIQFIQPL